MSNDLRADTSEMNVLFVHSAIDDYPLTTEEFRVYAHIARRAGLGEAWPAIASIALKCRIHEDTARRCVHALTAYRLLSVEDRSKQGKTNVYRITRASVWMTAEEVKVLQAGKAELEKARRAARMEAKVEVRPTGEPPKAKSTRKEGGVVNEGRGFTAKGGGSERREASETKGGEGGVTEGGGASETKGAEVDPLRGSLKVLQLRWWILVNLMPSLKNWPLRSRESACHQSPPQKTLRFQKHRSSRQLTVSALQARLTA
ncbi:helix-turn-helix domain-containing protein [Deinococcus altitudinis]|uniref:helix-turn-helix domain-containing protein n=1 Tax=Deinococcus altitudinis TaxID=468914 RepID=UPI0038912EC7